ncbi:UDP-3-O-acyl-N-acetylglucosamine deacetylase [Calidithermus chliarophilus]|uniref:UDP-3-O-acyl-N-acetylglucosamine deacetylase n=1 Tax=Calidithermus chliarophilus TaxID=52023 RepID=UPI000400313C|nr:UDP-3-O-acyl-N-acetylglucosamine deacetylase [Calidithermus chliarophilus]
MIEVSGIGLHSGERATVRFHPAEGPVRFRVGGVEIPARASAVVDTLRCTTLGAQGARVATVEHLLGALWLKNLWQGLLVEVEGPEIPILDGSAREWLRALEPLPANPLEPLPLPRPLRVLEDQGQIVAEPAPEFRLSVTITFKHPLIGYRRFESPPGRLAEVAEARTFGFLRDLEALRAQGLAHGASLENTLVYTETSSLNAPRLPDEPVRHKALDFLGDVYLAGAPFRGHFTVHRGSHRLHVELARALEGLLPA